MNELLKVYLASFKNQKYATGVIAVAEYEKKLTSSVKGDATEIIMYGIIGSQYDGISAKEVLALLEEVTTNKITVRINSIGGEFNEGIAIYNALKNHDAHVTAIVEGYACSIAADIAAAGDEIIVREGSLVMIHCALAPFLFGNAYDLEKEAVVLQKHDEAQLDIFSQKMSAEREEIKQMLKNETWFTAQETATIGFSTAVEGKVAEKELDADSFKNTVLARFVKEPDQQQQQQNKLNILAKFKRTE